MEKIKNLLIKYKILFIILLIVLCVLFSFVFYNSFGAKPTTVLPPKPPVENGTTTILQPIFDSPDIETNEGALKDDIEKINTAKRDLISKVLGKHIKIPLNFAISEAEILNKYVSPTAYKVKIYSPAELSTLLNNPKTEQVSNNTLRFYDVDRLFFVKTITNLFTEFSNNNKSGNYTITPTGTEQYISNYFGEYKKSVTKNEATHIVYKYQLLVNNLPVLSKAGFVYYIAVEDITTKRSTIDMFSFVPKSAQKIVSYSINAGSYMMSPLVSLDPNFSSFYINNDVTLVANDFDITPDLPIVDYYFDTENGYMIPLITKKAYLYDTVYSSLDNKGYLLVVNE